MEKQPKNPWESCVTHTFFSCVKNKVKGLSDLFRIYWWTDQYGCPSVDFYLLLQKSVCIHTTGLRKPWVALRVEKAPICLSFCSRQIIYVGTTRTLLFIQSTPVINPEGYLNPKSAMGTYQYQSMQQFKKVTQKLLLPIPSI